MRQLAETLALLGLVPLSPLAGAQTWSACGSERASVSPAGEQSDGDSIRPALSIDGNLVAFCSRAGNLDGPGNGHFDVYLRDRAAGTTVRLTKTAAGGFDTDGVSLNPTISGLGRYVLYHSAASNLVTGDTNGKIDVFVFDRLTSSTTRISVRTDGGEGNGDSQDPSVAAGGRFVAFATQATNLDDLVGTSGSEVFVHDRRTGASQRASVRPDGQPANGPSREPRISADARWVAFSSTASDLVPGDTNGSEDVFVRDLLLGTTERVSLADDQAQGNGDSIQAAVSANGRFVAFASTASNLVPGDTNGAMDVFVRDRWTGRTTLVTHALDGAAASGLSTRPDLSADGRYVSFNSTAPDLVEDDDNGTWDAFGHDRRTGTTWRAGEVLDGFGLPREPVISADGRHVAFTTIAAGVREDTNGLRDIYVTTCTAPGPFTYCAGKANSAGCAPVIYTTGTPSVSGGTFGISAAAVLNQTSGLLVYTTAGMAQNPLGDALLCVATPLVRTPGQSSGGTAGPRADCSGGYTFDFGALLVAGTDPGLVPGQRVWTQYWMRDTGHEVPENFALSNAVEFTVVP